MDQETLPTEEALRSKVVAICRALGARAAGCWRVEHEHSRLIQVAFVPGDGLDPYVARAFAEATRSVGMDQRNLGIVAAALSGQPAVSDAHLLEPESGSGRWLRAFGAGRSVAVPIPGDDARPAVVLSVALEGTEADVESVAQTIRELA